MGQVGEWEQIKTVCDSECLSSRKDYLNYVQSLLMCWQLYLEFSLDWHV